MSFHKYNLQFFSSFMMNKVLICVFVEWIKIIRRTQLLFLNFIHIKNMKHRGTLSLGVGRKSYTFQLLAVKQVSVWTKVFLALGSYWRDFWDANGNVNPNLMLTILTLTHKMYHQQSRSRKEIPPFLGGFCLTFFFNYYYFLNGFYTMSGRRGPQSKWTDCLYSV